MYSTFARTQSAFTAAILITLALSLTPDRYLGWTNDIAEIIRVPTRPFSHLGIVMGNWLRPPTSFDSDVPEESKEYVDHLKSERDKFMQLYAAEQMEVASLRQTLEQIQRVPIEARRPLRLLGASITAHSPTDRFGPVQLNRGSRAGVTPGDIAVYNGVYLVGRISDVSTFGSTLVPLTNVATGLMLVKITPPDTRDISVLNLVQLQPNGDGTFIADVESGFDIEVGYEAILSDRTWPDAARSMVIGTVASIDPIDDQPLRNRIVIKPRFHVSELSRVTLKLEQEEQEAGSLAEVGVGSESGGGGDP